MNGCHFIEVIGDNMQPTLRVGDFVMVAIAKSFMGDGIYAVSDRRQTSPSLYRCQHAGRGVIRMYLDSPYYSEQRLLLAEFERIVTGHVWATCNVLDRRYMSGLLNQRRSENLPRVVA